MNVVEKEWEEFSKHACDEAAYSKFGMFNLKLFYVKGFCECSNAFNIMSDDNCPRKERIGFLNSWFDELGEIIKNSGNTSNLEDLKTSLTPLEDSFTKIVKYLPDIHPLLIYEFKRALLAGFQHCLCLIGNKLCEKMPFDSIVKRLYKDSKEAMETLVIILEKGETAINNATNSKIH